MTTRSKLTHTTPDTLILGVATKGDQCAIVGSLRTITGAIETEIISMTGNGLYDTLCDALDEVRICKIPHLIIMTTNDELNRWLTPPIYVAPTDKTAVAPLFKGQKVNGKWIPDKPSIMQTGGDPHQWRLLRLLFPYIWKHYRISTLPGCEALLNGASNEQTATRKALP